MQTATRQWTVLCSVNLRVIIVSFLNTIFEAGSKHIGVLCMNFQFDCTVCSTRPRAGARKFVNPKTGFLVLCPTPAPAPSILLEYEQKSRFCFVGSEGGRAPAAWLQGFWETIPLSSPFGLSPLQIYEVFFESGNHINCRFKDFSITLKHAGWTEVLPIATSSCERAIYQDLKHMNFVLLVLTCPVLPHKKN